MKSLVIGTCAAAVSLFALSVMPASARDYVAKTNHLPPEEAIKTFKLPPGFEIQLVASEPEINKPMNLSFDAQGRLWVTSVVEYPDPVPPGQTGRDTIKILSDIGEDGRAKKITTFAEGLNIPIGVLPTEQGAIAFSIPQILNLQDTDKDGKADKREPLLGGEIGHIDTHGLTGHFTVGFDGWVYANHGYANQSELKGSDGSSIKMHSGNNYRFRMDGSHVEYFAHGQVNPFGLTFSPLGDLFSADCHTRPQMMLLRGGWYQSFGKPHDGIGFAPEIMKHSHGSTAIAGTAYYDADHFPSEYRGWLFLGNCVTNAVNSDRVEWQGSSPKAIETPDLVQSSDPWFRPVDVLLGPDGAIYIADFYNKIIGHYEVPLTHPDRDRTSGRIWRVVYRGPDGKGKIPALPDLSKLGAAELVNHLATPNIAVRMMAARQLAERVGKDAIEPVKAAVEKPASPIQKAHALWVLHRLNALSPETIIAATKDSNRDVRVHAMRIISETPKAPAEVCDAARAALKDSDAFVQRAAADALGQQPALNNVRALLAARSAVPETDPQLLHVVRMSLRNQLEVTDVLTSLSSLKLNDQEVALLADIVPGVSNAEVKPLVVMLLERGVATPEQSADLMLRAAKLLDATEIDKLAEIVFKRLPDDVDVQRGVAVGIINGLAERQNKPGPKASAWASKLARELLSLDPSVEAWTPLPLPGTRDPYSPWTAERVGGRRGKILWSSRPVDEELTGILRSQPFEIPAKLSFTIAGHSDAPKTRDSKRNVLRLHLAKDNKVIAETPAPRTDKLQSVTWDLSQYAGQQGYIEATDAAFEPAFAWFAFGAFEPNVVPTPNLVGDIVRDRQIAAAIIGRALKMEELNPKFERIVSTPGADPEARAAAARAISAARTPQAAEFLGKVALSASSPQDLRVAVAESLAEQNTPQAREKLLAAIATANERFQRILAMPLLTTPEGTEALLTAIKNGKISNRLLIHPAVKERVALVQLPNIEQRIADLTKGVDAGDGTIAVAIRERITEYDPAKTKYSHGKELFAKTCAVCHQVGGNGALIGPQLDGISQRGLERMVEDILDPNRNVDGAFRETLLKVKVNGKESVVSGLVRKEDDEFIILADNQGRDHSVRKSDIVQRRDSQLSIMPSDFATSMSKEDFFDLINYLMMQ